MSDNTRRPSRSGIANERRLAALGDAIDQRETPPRSRAPRRKTRRGRRHSRRLIALGTAAVVVLGFIGGGYIYAQWKFSHIHKMTVANEVQPLSGEPINILSIGSDARNGLTGLALKQTGAVNHSVSGQRSDVIKIIHLDPATKTMSMISIPRDTIVSLLDNASIYGRFNRINVNLLQDAKNPEGNPSLLVKTIEANFGIPINYTIVVGFAGLINSAVALGGVYLNFPYPSVDDYSGLRILHPGCQLVTGFQALAVARSRHFYYLPHGQAYLPRGSINYSWLTSHGWYYDGNSDWSRIKRQDSFLKAMFYRAKGEYNPIKLNRFVSSLPGGIVLDSRLTFNTLLSIAMRFHGVNPAAIRQYTMPTTSGQSPVGDVLFVNQTLAQPMLTSIFGSQLHAPTNPPPNHALQTPQPPVVVTTTTTVPKHQKHSGTTTTTVPAGQDQIDSWDPVPCTPK